MSKRILVTGADGFIGAHFVEHVIANTDWDIDLLCSFQQGGIPERIEHSSIHSGIGHKIRLFHHDLRAPLSAMLGSKLSGTDIIVNFAAESHVDTSIMDPRYVIENNVACALTMLDAAVGLPDLEAFVQISTDEVYGPARVGEAHVEWSPALPSNPYSASKVAQEAVAHCYWRTFGVPLILTNCMNNIGERQHPEKYLPMLVRNIMAGQPVKVHVDSEGKPGSRVYLHARSQSDAILFLLKQGGVAQYPEADRPDRWNIAGQVEIDNEELAHKVARILGKGLDLHYKVADEDRPGHDMRYEIDGRKLRRAGWHFPVDFEESLRRTVEWYRDHPEWLVL